MTFTYQSEISYVEQKEREPKRMDDHLFECEIPDSASMPRTRTTQVPAQGFAPKCSLEQFALP
jgi:hypothetical protein